MCRNQVALPAPFNALLDMAAACVRFIPGGGGLAGMCIHQHVDARAVYCVPTSIFRGQATLLQSILDMMVENFDGDAPK